MPYKWFSGFLAKLKNVWRKFRAENPEDPLQIKLDEIDKESPKKNFKKMQKW